VPAGPHHDLAVRLHAGLGVPAEDPHLDGVARGRPPAAGDRGQRARRGAQGDGGRAVVADVAQLGLRLAPAHGDDVELGRPQQPGDHVDVVDVHVHEHPARAGEVVATGRQVVPGRGGDPQQVAQVPGEQHPAQGVDRRVEAAHEPGPERHARRLGQRAEVGRDVRVERDRLLAQHRHAELQERVHDARMQARRRGDDRGGPRARRGRQALARAEALRRDARRQPPRVDDVDLRDARVLRQRLGMGSSHASAADHSHSHLAPRCARTPRPAS
jgi:hypothetical protein